MRGWWSVSGLLMGCATHTATQGTSATEVMYVTRGPIEARLCLSPVEDAGRLRGAAAQFWSKTAAHLVAGDLEAAHTLLDAAPPQHPAANALRGALALLEGDVTAARSTYRTLVNNHPSDACMQQTMAAIYMADREPVMAKTHATDAWRLQPDDPDVLFVYALAWMAAGDDSRASGALRKVIAARPSHPGAGFLLGEEYLRRGHADLAIPMLEAAHQGGVDVAAQLAGAYFQTRQLDGYVRTASQAGWPMGDGGALGTSDDPLTEWKTMLGVANGERLWVEMDTTMGAIRCELFWEEAPVTVSNFVGLIRGTQPWTDPETQQIRTEPLYPQTQFHRIIDGFMIQGGDPLGTGAGGPGYRFPDEITVHRAFAAPGVLAMANAGPNTNGSQFFITEAPTPHLDGAHTIFGQCDADSLSTVQAITQVATNADGQPLEPITLVHIAVVSE